jgi:hypothetical protein
MKKNDPQFAPLPDGSMFDLEYFAREPKDPRQALFDRLGESTGLDKEEFDRRMEEAASKENLRAAMDAVFPRLRKSY